LRFRYYLLIIACVLGDESKLLRKVCLAAALIFPALAAVHAIVLAALHNDGRSSNPITGRELMKFSRVYRYGYLWSVPIMLDRHLGCSCNSQTVPVSLNLLGSMLHTCIFCECFSAQVDPQRILHARHCLKSKLKSGQSNANQPVLPFRAYWEEPGKIMILPWTILILAGECMPSLPVGQPSHILPSKGC